MKDSQAVTWLKNPASVFTGSLLDSSDTAANGLLIKGDKIIELVAANTKPSQAYDVAFIKP